MQIMAIDREIKLLTLDALPIAGIIENCAPEEAEIYYPANYLIFVEKGTLRLKVEQQSYAAPAGSFIVVRKYTKATYHKLPEENEDGFREHIFILHDNFIRETIRTFKAPTTSPPIIPSLVLLPHSTILEALIRSLEVYIEAQTGLDESLLILKTREALMGLLSARPDLIHTFIDYAKPEKADLLRFMEHNFMRNLPLRQFAQLSGRSLATFNRDFRKLFHAPPYQWIKEQRLLLAKRMLAYTPMTPSAVYLEVGFEDLAHFSRSFKKYFGHNPSEVVKETTA